MKNTIISFTEKNIEEIEEMSRNGLIIEADKMFTTIYNHRKYNFILIDLENYSFAIRKLVNTKNNYVLELQIDYTELNYAKFNTFNEEDYLKVIENFIEILPNVIKINNLYKIYNSNITTTAKETSFNNAIGTMLQKYNDEIFMSDNGFILLKLI